MKSSKAEGRGAQEPRVAREPACEYTDGEDAAELVSAYGYTLDPWQCRVLDAWLARDADDRFTATSCGLSVPRQNGKNALLEVRELYGIVTMGERILHTAHEVKTARKAFLRLASFFENERQYPELARLVKFIRKTNGQEAIELTEEAGGGSVEFSARSRGAARGFTVDTVVFDEAQELTDEQLEALLPTLAAAPSGNRQYIYTGTPPGPSSPGEVFRRTRKAALDGKDEHMAWHEWSVEELPAKGATADDLLALAYDTNPAMGYRIEAGFVVKEALAMSLDGFARERLGWWSADVLQCALLIDHAKWKACEIDPSDVPASGKLAYGVKFSSDGRGYALSVALIPKGGTPHVELIEAGDTASGVSRLAAWLIQRRDRCAVTVIDGLAGAQALAQQLTDAGFKRNALRLCRASDAAAAASGFVDAVNALELTHIDSPALDESATRAVKRVIGRNGAFGFGSAPDCDATPVESAALALWGAKTTKRDPNRKAKVHI